MTMAFALRLGLEDPEVAPGEWNLYSLHTAGAVPEFRKVCVSVLVRAF